MPASRSSVETTLPKVLLANLFMSGKLEFTISLYFGGDLIESIVYLSNYVNKIRQCERNVLIAFIGKSIGEYRTGQMRASPSSGKESDGGRLQRCGSKVSSFTFGRPSGLSAER